LKLKPLEKILMSVDFTVDNY